MGMVKNHRKWERLGEITCRKCEQCPSMGPNSKPITHEPAAWTKYRCCDKMFCEMVKRDLDSRGVKYQETGHDIPFMGAKGCVLEPWERRFCTGFVCQPHFADRGFRREYGRLAAALGLPAPPTDK